MDPQALLAPAVAAALTAACLGAVGLVKTPSQRAPARRWFWMAGGVVTLVVAGSVLGLPSLLSLPPGLAAAGLGVGLLALGAALAVSGSRLRRQADALRACAPVPLDEALAQARRGRVAGWAVFAGQLGADSPVTSPGGIVCAFYEAELRERLETGGKGPLLGRERSAAPLLTLRGERGEAPILIPRMLVLAQTQARTCRAEGRPLLIGEQQLVGGAAPNDAVSFERVGRLGEKVLVLGRLRPSAGGSFELAGSPAHPSLLVVGDDVERSALALAQRAWTRFACALGLSIAAAYLLARA
jgi:hypothetical protein